MTYHPAIKRQLSRKRLADFTQFTWPDYQMARHHRTMCAYLDALADGRIKRLMIFAPPRHGKSELASRRLPAKYLGDYPDNEVMLTSYTSELASRMNRDVQRIIDSPTYAALYPNTRLGGRARVKGQKQATRTDGLFELAGQRGGLRSAGVGGGITGMGFKLGIIDDPYKDAEEALSATIRDKTEEWYRSTFLTRQAPEASILVMMTRWHHDDLAGVLLREQPGMWEVLSFPAIAEGVLHPTDERQDGEALWPERFPLPWLEDMRASVGPFWWSALYRQTPDLMGGNLFDPNWFGQFRDGGTHWHISGRRDPVGKHTCQYFASVDPAASEKQAADFTAIVVGCLTPEQDLLILDVVNERLNPDKIPPRMLEVARKWDIEFYSFEDTGFQVAISSQARRLPGMPPIRESLPHGRGKVVRATPAIVKASAGQCFVPTPSPDWVSPFFEQLKRFRGEDETNDMVDAFGDVVRQCPRMIGETSDRDAKQVSERLNLHKREETATRRGLWGRT